MRTKPATSPFDLNAHVEVWYRRMQWRVIGGPFYNPSRQRKEVRLARMKADGRIQRDSAAPARLQGID